jgi:hypothetical protein
MAALLPSNDCCIKNAVFWDGCYAVWPLLTTDVLQELSASIIRGTRIGELGTTLTVTSNRNTLRINTVYYII